MPSLVGKIAVVTGANSGLGEEASANLLALGATVFLLVRDVAKGDAAMHRLLARVGEPADGSDGETAGSSENPMANVSLYGLTASSVSEAEPSAPSAASRLCVVPCDLSSLDSVAAAAETVRSGVEKLHKDTPSVYGAGGDCGIDLLLLNAGVMMCALQRTEMVDGDGNKVDIQLGTNHVGHFALFAALLPLLARASPTRVVVVSSNAHKFGTVDLADPTFSKGRGYSKIGAYGQSKAANLLFLHEATRRIQRLNAAGKSNITITAAHPGWTSTPLMRHSWALSLISPLMAQVRPSCLNCCTSFPSDALADRPGRHTADSARLARPRSAPRRLLWALAARPGTSAHRRVSSLPAPPTDRPLCTVGRARRGQDCGALQRRGGGGGSLDVDRGRSRP